MLSEGDLSLINAAGQSQGAVVLPRPDARSRDGDRGTPVGRTGGQRDAWLTAYPGGELRAQLTLAFVEIDCGPGEPIPIARALAADVHVPTVEYVAGHCDLLAHVVAPNLREVSDYVIHRLSALPGVVATRTIIAPRLFTEGSRWRVQAISPGQCEVLAARPPKSARRCGSVSSTAR
jgi:DNA-binding Lrp family transcriptional regulator